MAVLPAALRTACASARSPSNPPSPSEYKKTHSLSCVHFYGGRGWIRTTEVTDNRFTVCPLWPLGNSPIFDWSWWTDSNPRPADYKSAALPTELHQHFFVLSYNIISSNFCQQFFIEIIKISSYINVFGSVWRAYQVICNAYSYNKRRSAFNIRDRFWLCYISGWLYGTIRAQWYRAPQTATAVYA